MTQFDELRAQVTSRFADAVRLCDLTTKVNTLLSTGLLSSLPRAQYASHNSARSDKTSSCFEGTRTEIVDTIFEWILDPDPSSDQIFFLSGIAGVGKTTVARTVAEKARRDGLLGGDFFFTQQGEADLHDSRKVFPTLAYQLAQFDPEFGQLITEALENDPQAPFDGLQQQLNRLIINPLSNVKRDPKRTVVIVFDAFDECEAHGAHDILELLVASIPTLPFFLKVFLTGRPEDHIVSVLTQPTEGLATAALHDIAPLIVKDDIRRYLRAQLAELPGKLRLKLPADWAAEHEIELLIEKSDGLFIYAVTAIRFLSDPIVADPRVQLDILMSVLQLNTPGPDGTQPFRDLDALYLQLLLGALHSTNTPHVLRVLQLVLGTIVILRDPLPQAALEELASLRLGGATPTLRLLQSVIIPASLMDDCPRIYHTSFSDFVQDPIRCADQRFYIDTPLHEARMALTCLKLINSTLHPGMITDMGDAINNCDVEDLESKVASAYSSAIQYAARHWTSHLANVSHDDRDVIAALETFALRSLLPWLEEMSWLGETRASLLCIEAGKKWAVRIGLALLQPLLTSTLR